jgi:hypothetical protein
MKKAGVSENVIEEGDEEDGDEGSSSSSSGEESSSSSSPEDMDSDEEHLTEDCAGKGLSMMELHKQTQHAKDASQSPATTSRKTLLDQFETTFDSQKGKGKGGGKGGGVLQGIRGAKKERAEKERADAEALDEMGMVAGRKKRVALTVDLGLSAADRAQIDLQHHMMTNAPKKLHIHPKAKASKILAALIDVFQRVWLRCRHLALMLQNFTEGTIVRMPDFGSYRVEVVVLLFCRVVDVQNFDLVWERLTPQEIACIYCRLGMLNFFNPLKLEGCYSLDVSRYEERVVAKMLAAISTVEPGENWLEETFRWEYFAECIPGWELTKSWLKDENMPHRGYLYLEYYSGGCTKFGVPLLKEGCNPNLIFRKSLLALVYLNEDSIIDDDCNGRGGKLHKRLLRVSKDGKKVKSESAGAGYIKNYMEYYTNLLAPVASPSVRIARGEETDKVFSKLKYVTTNIVRDLPKISNVYFGAGNVVIDKSSEKGKMMMERIQERLLKRAKDLEQETAQSEQNNLNSDSSAGKKRMDLSVDTSNAKRSAKVSKTTAGVKNKGVKVVSSMDKMLSEVAMSTANPELTNNETGATSKLQKKSKMEKDRRLQSDQQVAQRGRGGKGVSRSSSMMTVQSADRAAIVSKVKESRGYIERGK